MLLSFHKHVLSYYALIFFFLIPEPDKHFPGGELQAIENRTRSCFPAAAAFLVQKILQV